MSILSKKKTSTLWILLVQGGSYSYKVELTFTIDLSEELSSGHELRSDIAVVAEVYDAGNLTLSFQQVSTLVQLCTNYEAMLRCQENTFIRPSKRFYHDVILLYKAQYTGF